MALYKASPGKADLYKDFAAKLYNIGETEVIKTQRQVGKVAHLGLGFGAGAPTFQKVAKLMGGVDLDLPESEKITYRWRDEYQEIVQGWKTCHDMLPEMAAGGLYEVDPWGLVTTTQNALVLPSGRHIRYPALRKEEGGNGRDEWWYGTGRNRARIYAGKIDENIVQALARDIIAENAFAVYKELKVRPSLMVHDELVYVVHEDQAQHVLDTVQRIMRTPPVWWPQLITWSEGDIADTYGDAK
jgi:DNA polymerase